MRPILQRKSIFCCMSSIEPYALCLCCVLNRVEVSSSDVLGLIHSLRQGSFLGVYGAVFWHLVIGFRVGVTLQLELFLLFWDRA